MNRWLPQAVRWNDGLGGHGERRHDMKLTMYPVSLMGNTISREQFGFTLTPGCGFNPAGVDSIQFWCRGVKKRICSVDLTLGPAVEADEQGRRRWHWDGNMEAPTLAPSIDCGAKCGWHGHIQNGDATP